MFCTECGSQLPDNAKFCPSCGYKITANFASPKIGEDSAPAGERVEFLGQSFELSPNIAEAGRLYTEFHQLAEIRTASFMAHMSHQYEADLDIFLSNIDKDISELFHEFYQKVLDYLISRGIYSCDITQIKNTAAQYTILCPKILKEIRSAHQAAEQAAQNEISYRAQRKENRGRIIGGGFGLGGAIKGMTEAAAINMATGMAHSVFNAVGNSATRSHLAKGKDNVFYSIEVRKEIQTALQYDCTHIYYALIDIYNASGLDPLPKYTDQDFLGAAAVQEKLLKGEIPSKDVPTVVCGMIRTFPFASTFYETAEKMIPEAKGPLHHLAEKCGFAFTDESDRCNENRLRLAKRLVENPFFVDAAGTIGKEDFSKTLMRITSNQKSILGSRIRPVSKADDNYTLICSQIQPDETPLLFWDRTVKQNGKDGQILTDKAIYTVMLHAGHKRTPLEELDLFIHNGKLYLSKAEYDEMGDHFHSKAGPTIDFASVYCVNQMGQRTDGSMENYLMNFIVDYLLYLRNRVPLQDNLVEEICSLAEVDYEEFKNAGNSASQEDKMESSSQAKTEKIDRIVNMVFQNSLVTVQKELQYSPDLISCGSLCPDSLKKSIAEFLKQQLTNDADELGLLYYHTGKVMDRGAFLISNQALYVYPFAGDCVRFPYDEIRTMDVKKKLMFTYIYINGNVELPFNMNAACAKELSNDMMSKIIPLLKTL